MKPRVIALTGGIGAGKSVVSRVLRAMGWPVYDCDSEARRIVDSSPRIIAEIGEKVAPEAVRPDGTLNRPALAARVFADRDALRRLNSIVHGAVKADLESRIAASASPLFFVETAILYESGFDALADEVWEVTAPAEERISRVMERSGLSREQVESRMASQTCAANPAHKIISNSTSDALLPRILTLINETTD